MRGQFWCKFGFCSSRKVWVMRGMGYEYGLRGVRLSEEHRLEYLSYDQWLMSPSLE